MKPVSRNVFAPAMGAGVVLLTVSIAAVGISLLWSKVVLPAHDKAQKRAHWISSGYKETLSIPISVTDREYPSVYHHPFPLPYSIRGVIPETPNTKQLYITVSHYSPSNARVHNVLLDRIIIVLTNDNNEWRYGTWSVQTANGHTIPDASRTVFSFRPDPDWLKTTGMAKTVSPSPLNVQ